MAYNNRVNSYFETIQSIPSTENSSSVKEKFEIVFKDFKNGATEEKIRGLYADEFYFNDTFKTFSNIEELIPYMEETAKNVEVTTVDILDVVKGDDDYYLRWSMTMEFTAKGSKVKSTSIGMTQLRFNESGKVILHQDYWDGAEGFYQHLPFVGFIVRKIRDSL